MGILNSREKVSDENYETPNDLLDRNIQIIYKDDVKLFEESISNLLNIHSREELHALYKSAVVLDDNSSIVDGYQSFRNRLINAPNESIQNEENVMFFNFASKVSHVTIQSLKESSEYKKSKFVLADEEQFIEHISFQVHSIILKICYRTLVLDFNVCLKNDKLVGETKEQKYKYYNDHFLGDTSYLDTFFDVYPGLLRILSNEVRKIVTTTTRILSDYADDHNRISSLFFKTSHLIHIDAVILGLGDSHSDGKRVAKLILQNNKKVIYKPRNLTIDHIYSNICKFINRKADERYSIKTPKIITGQEHGWAEFISYEECTNRLEVHNFYKKMGAQLALLYALNAVDFHSENLIAHGSDPVLIDLESLFHMPYTEEKPIDAFDKAKQKLSNSVKSIGLLPFIFGSNHIDVSGIGQKGEVQTFIKVPKITMDSGTVKVEREYGKMNAALNHPKMDGNYVDASKYLEDIKEGFSEIYEIVQQNKDNILSILEESNEEIFVRFIPKPTVRYASLLELSLHPRFLHNYIDREVFLAKIWEDAASAEIYKKLAIHEFNDLINDDVPFFSLSIKSNDLLSSSEEKIRSFFKSTPLEVVKQKMEQMDETDLDLQKKLIDLSILSKNRKPLNNPVLKKERDYQGASCHSKFFIEKAIEITKKINSQMITGNNSGRKNYSWINSTPVGVDEIHWNHSPMGDSLYNGLSGMAMMYLALWTVTKEDAYLKTGRQITEDLMTRISNWEEVNKKDMIPVGAFTGASSYIYLLMNYYIVTGEKEFKEAALQLTERLTGIIENDKECDIISGVAGAIAVLVSCYESEGDSLFLDVAVKCGEHLANRAIEDEHGDVSWIGISKTPLTGFSHGNAGYIYALAMLDKHLKRADFGSLIENGLRYENRQMIKTGWKDKRMDIEEVSAASWCHGSPGILLSRLNLAHHHDQNVAEQAKQDTSYAIGNIMEDGFGREHSLCHGDIGNAMVLIGYGRACDNERYTNIGKNLLYESILRGEEDGYQCGVGDGLDSPNLMIGLAGIVYGLAYASDERVPLLLDLKIGKNLPQVGHSYV